MRSTAANPISLANVATPALAFLVASGVAAAFCAYYVGSEQPVYFWDWSGYFNVFRGYGALFVAGGLDWLKCLAHSIQHDDYNLAIVTPMLPLYALFGGSRIVYITTIAVLYLLPAAAVAARLAARVGFVEEKPSFFWLFATAAFFWPFWFAAIRGLPDVAGLIPLGLATLLVIETGYLTRASVKQGMALGLMIWSAFLLRRWYAYAGVSLETVAIIFAAWTASRRRPTDLGCFRTALLAFVSSIATIVACILALQLPLAITILRTSYADIYAAYQKPLGVTADLFLAQSGGWFLAAAFLGVLRALLTRNKAIFFVLALAAMTSVLFLKTQAPGVQHVLPVFLWLFPVAIFGAAWPLTGRPRASGVTSGFAKAVIILMTLASFLSVFSPPVGEALALGRPLLPTQTYHPLKLENLRNYQRLTFDLTSLLRAPAERVAIFASSPNLSDSLLTSLDPALDQFIVRIGDVDARDGLRLAPFEARYAVVTATPTMHLPPSQQRVVSIPNAMILDGKGPGAAYRKVAGPYALDGGVTAYIYQRQRPFSAPDADALTRALRFIHPDWKRAGGLVAR